MIHDLWYKHTVIYNLDLETFMDANGDGVGDFEGLMRRIDYLYSLGIDTIWLSPFQPSPNRDNGYDIKDYYGVDPRHGSLGDFVEFMNLAHNRGIKVLLDLVVNHTSDQHRWFQEARKDKSSPYHDWYVWADEPPPDLRFESVFPGAVDGTWSYDEKAGAYYFHRFYPFQPDLNTDNPDVRTEIRRIMGFWLQLDVQGFRVDALPFVLESLAQHELAEGKGKPAVHFEYLREMRDFLQWRRGDAILLGEANVAPDQMRPYAGNGSDGLHMMFNFYVNQYLFYALATGEVQPLIEALEATRILPSCGQWAYFLRNHDELSLDKLTQQEQEKVFAAFGPEAEMRAYGRGIRRRLAPMLGDRRRIELAYSMLFALPGTPVLYYGDEIGMGEDLRLPERMAVRTPMQWADEPQAGFSTAKKLVRPVIKTGPYSYRQVNVASQRRDPNSLLNWMAAMIRLRQECSEIGLGAWRVVESGSPCVLALLYEWQGAYLMTLHNFSPQPQQVEIDLEVEGGDTLDNLLVSGQSQADDSGKHCLTLDAYGYQWHRVGTPRYILERERA
ncbi:MAG TPA: alpha-amylase family protein [Caldilineaceae bacterium]|nr:alpha-amylase family protein [Caldilineaceae bacterium]